MIGGFCVFSEDGGPRRVGWTRAGRVLDLAAAGLGDDFARSSLNPFMARGRAAWERALERIEGLPADALGPSLEQVELHLPFNVADYVDFYASLEHASAMGRMFRPGADPLPAAWRHLPIGYHGRAGSVRVSGSDVPRPQGQVVPDEGGLPAYAPSRRLDFELELGFVVGTPSTPGLPLSVGQAADHVFGAVLVNDWSARDIQRFEAVPLGPFLGKSFLTSVSALVVPLALLEPFRVEAPAQDPEPLPHLRDARDWGLDLALEVELNGTVVSRGSARTLYWTMPQQLAHLTSNGSALRTGDLIATGTISGAEPGSAGSLIELTENGAVPVVLADGGARGFLEDGDEVRLAASSLPAGLLEVRGRVRPARSTTTSSVAP